MIMKWAVGGATLFVAGFALGAVGAATAKRGYKLAKRYVPRPSTPARETPGRS